MKAIIKKSILAEDTILKTIEKPEIKEDEVLLKVSAVGICGSDLHIYSGDSGYDWIDYPIVFGHEFVGTIYDANNNDSIDLIGKRVIVSPYLPCNVCEHCKNGDENQCDFDNYFENKTPPLSLQYGFRRDGGMSEYVSVPVKNLVYVNENIPNELAAISEAVAVAYTSVKKMKSIKNKNIAVFGPGPIGMSVALLLKNSGANVVLIGTEEDEMRLSIGEKMGFKKLIIEEGLERKLISINPGGYDATFDCAAHSSVMNTSLKVLKKGGTLISVGISTSHYSIPIDQLVRGELKVLGSYGTTKNDMIETVSLIAEDVELFQTLLTDVFAIEDYKSAFNTMLEKTSLKVVLKFTE